ncbi:MAG: hypothetical protein HYU74_12695 [Dechloromonas sp.]|nr:hypothetical protein [Dechloromonas sp.]
MAITFGFFSDSALTTPIAAPLQFVQADTSPVPADKIVYFGSPTANRVVEAESNPGSDLIVVSVDDAGPGTGSPAADVKLALSAGGLDAAVGGAALNLPSSVLSGAANAIAIHIRVTDSTHSIGLKTDLSLTTNPLAEFTA